MNLKSLRDHYYTKDNGIKWIPKKPFESVMRVRAAGFSEDNWKVYWCCVCNQYHISKKKGSNR